MVRRSSFSVLCLLLACSTSPASPAPDVHFAVDGGPPPAVDASESPGPDGDPSSEAPTDEPLVFLRGARFSDVGASWARDLIHALSDDGVVAGYRDGTFRPERRITRAELAALLRAAFPRCAPVRAPQRFSDVPGSHWAHDAVRHVSRCGIMSGYPGGLFGPSRPTTRLEAVVALHGALQRREPAVRRRAERYAAWTTRERARAVAERFFDAERIAPWAHAALLSATDAGMVVLGEDRVGFERGERRVLVPRADATRADVTALLWGAHVYPNGRNGADLAAPAPSPGAGFRAAPYTGAGLRDGEWVLTFDDGPRAHSARIARTLRARGVTAAFFWVTHNLGWRDDAGVHLRPTHLDAAGEVLRQGHVVANHMHRHCIHGLSCGGRGVAELPAGELAFELETAHAILRATVANAGFAPSEKLLPLFRAPGGQTRTSWSATAARHANRARVPASYRGNVFWDLPGEGHDISACWSRGLGGAECARRYLDEIDRRGMRRGVILVHDNFGESVDMVAPLVDGIRARGMRFVHPRCVVGCRR